MRTHEAALGALLLITAPLGAQQPMGVVLHPVGNPLMPDIVAYERVVNDRQELRFVRVSNQRVSLATRTPVTTRPGVVVTIPDAGAFTTLSAYTGQLDWRPVADQGRSWFAYVASDESGGLALMLNYLDEAGELASTDPVRIPFAGQVRTPRWSHDGRHLAFVSDSSILHIVPDVVDALRAGASRRFRVTRVAAASKPALSPAWSPLGDHIAYGTQVESEGRLNGAIEVLPVNRTSGEVSGVPIVITGELSGDDEYRPSWSRDGKYVAFYADRAGTDGARQPVSIGIAEVVLNPRTGQAYRGIVKEGSQRWLGENVIPDDLHGPAWTSITEGSQRKDAVAYVRRDAARSDAIAVVDVQRWLAQLSRDQYEAPIAAAADAVSPRSVGSLEMNRRMRFVFTEVKDGSEVVGIRDMAAAWARGPEATPVVVAAAAPPPSVTAPAAAAPTPAPVPGRQTVMRSHRGRDVARAVLFPGLGQLSAGKRIKGSVLAGVGLAGAGVGIAGWRMMGPPLADGRAVVLAVTNDPSTLGVYRPLYDGFKSDYEGKRSMAYLGGAVFATAWLYGIIDASFSGAPGREVTLTVAPDRSAGATVNVGLTVAVGHLPGGW